MTNEEAIKQLKDMQSRCTNGYDAEAINIAIKALEEIDDLSENLAWYINERNRLMAKLKEKEE